MFNNIIFEDRDDAAKQLLNILPIVNMLKEDWVVLATSAGAVSIAQHISSTLNSRFDFLFTQKIFTSRNRDCEIAIITETGEIVIHEELMKSFSLDLEYIYKKVNKKYNNELNDYKAKYRNSLDIINLEGKNVLLIDEGLNTGLTMMACIKSVINEKAKSICVAVPVLPEVTINDIETIADDLYYVEAPAHFVSIDFYYKILEDITLSTIKKEKYVNNM